MYDIEQLRRTEFPLSEHEIYFNHASISPLPVRTRRAMEESLAQLSAQPWRYYFDTFLPMSELLHQELASFVNAAGPHEIVQIPTTSTGLNMIAQAIQWQPGDNVLFCEVEFPSNAYPWLALERKGVEVRQVPAVDGGLTLGALAPLVDGRTRLVAASAIQFFSGHRTNLTAIGSFCHARDILFVVDAIQGIGHIPIDVQAMHIDVLAAGGQKSMLATPGIGFMYVRNEISEATLPQAIGPNATRDYDQWLNYDLTPLPGAARFAMGTFNVAAWCGLRATIGLLRELGLENVDRHTATLAAEAIAILERLGYDVVTPPGQGPIVTFKSGLSDDETDRLLAALLERRVSVVKHRNVNGIPHIRLSFHAYNTREELHCFETHLQEAYRSVIKG